MEPRTIKVAVVGTGLAGLTAAYLLSQTHPTEHAKIEVHVFEREPRLGMDAWSVSLKTPGKQSGWRVDVPMRGFQGGYYSQLISLYKHLGVRFHQIDFSYSFSLLTSHSRIRLIWATGQKTVRMPSTLQGSKVATKDRSSTFQTYGVPILMSMHLLFCYLWLLWHSLPFTRSQRLKTMSLRQWSEITVPKNPIAKWIGLNGAWREFTSAMLVPFYSAICTAPGEDIWNHPAEEILDYVWLTLGSTIYSVERSVGDVVAGLIASVLPSHIHLSSPLSAIRPSSTPNLITLVCKSEIHQDFNHVIFATQAKYAIPILASYLPSLENNTVQQHTVAEQIACLKSFRYRPSVIINHTDESLIPVDEEARRAFNFVFSPTAYSSDGHKDLAPNCMPPSYTTATQLLYHPSSSEGPPSLYQTTNPIVPLRKDTIVSVARLERPVMTVESKQALQGLCRKVSEGRWGRTQVRLGPLQGVGAGKEAPGLWFCGSYAHVGIPLLEGCVGSARNVVKGLLASEGMEATGEGWAW